MPKFISPIGTPCTIDEAKPGGFLRAGYKELLEDGEYLQYDVMCRDAAPARSAAVFLTDGVGKQLSHARYGSVIDSELTRMREVEENAYQRSKTALNDWRRDTAKTAETVGAIRDARWL